VLGLKENQEMGLLERIYTVVFKNIWPLWLGGVLLAILNILYLLLLGKAWRITTGFTYWSAWVVRFFGGEPNEWSYFIETGRQAEVGQTFFTNGLSLLSFGIILGALLSVLLSGQFKFKKIKTAKQAIVAVLGGIIMGYGTRIALGCNIGAFFSAVPSLSLSGYVFGCFVVIGAWLGSKFLIRFLL